MLLRASGQVNGLDIDVDSVLDREAFVDAGVPSGAALLRFVQAVEAGTTDEVAAARKAVLDAVGPDAMVEAAATIAIFNGLVRLADGTGIALDGGVWDASDQIRARSGVDDFAGAANSTHRDRPSSSGPLVTDVSVLFSD